MRIAVVGGFGVGLTMRFRDAPDAGESVIATSFATHLGGKGSNQAVGARRLGAEVSLITAIGDDEYGRWGRDLWQREGVMAEAVLVTEHPTMVAFVLVEDGGENRIGIYPGALDSLDADHLDDVREAIDEAQILVVSMEVPVPFCAAALRLAHETDTVTVLNPAPASAIPAEMWRWVDFVTPNATEAAVILGVSPSDVTQNPAGAARALRAMTDATVVLTLGRHGVAVCDASGARVIPAVPASRVVDTTGAGDAFSSALAVAIGEGADVDDAVRFAAAAGSVAVQTNGVIDALASPHDLKEHAPWRTERKAAR